MQELCLEECPKLSGSLPKHLPSLTILDINGCEQLETSLPIAAPTRELGLLMCSLSLASDFGNGPKL